MACRQQYIYCCFSFTPLIWLALAAAAAAASGAKSDCPQSCGNNVSIPFPFGIGDECHIGEPWFNLSCSPVAKDCYNRSGETEGYDVSIELDDDAPIHTLKHPYHIRKAIGCDSQAYIYPFIDRNDATGCLSTCQGMGMVENKSCSGIGCCQASIPLGCQELGDASWMICRFNTRYERDEPVQVVLDWTICQPDVRNSTKRCEKLRLQRARTAYAMILIMDTVAIAEEDTEEILTLMEETAA
ncbi:wall-associated receptor kinase 2-like protein [Cinnamomum micranthum f. kanehirae]|uniref:Wall-associated receptor kinase 2-like protein n=1 Tax=Cinnamomum micranthum f. kanehirae TaxID=337451 RepID=A0A3S3Q0E0_9MAGN|nr:wall-associated receptor kinase 2-like protein [Cinnamomum micranthum f. kanehirae]